MLSILGHNQRLCVPLPCPSLSRSSLPEDDNSPRCSIILHRCGWLVSLCCLWSYCLRAATSVPMETLSTLSKLSCYLNGVKVNVSKPRLMTKGCYPGSTLVSLLLQIFISGGLGRQHLSLHMGLDLIYEAVNICNVLIKGLSRLFHTVFSQWSTVRTHYVYIQYCQYSIEAATDTDLMKGVPRVLHLPLDQDVF